MVSNEWLSFSTEPIAFSGKIGFKIGWNRLDVDLPSEENLKALNPSNDECQIRSPQMNEIIQKWYFDKLIDPMDPIAHDLLSKSLKSDHAIAKVSEQKTKSNSIFFVAIQTNGEQPSTDNKMFVLNEELLTFCDAEKFYSDKRLNMLAARFRCDANIKNFRFLQNNEMEIEMPLNGNLFENELWIDPIDVQRHQGKKYLNYVYELIMNHCNVANRNYNQSDLLVGDTPPTFYGIMQAITNMFTPRRPLHPNRHKAILSATRRNQFGDIERNRFNIILNVFRASGIPYRSELENTRRISISSSTTTNREFKLFSCFYYFSISLCFFFLLANSILASEKKQK